MLWGLVIAGLGCGVQYGLADWEAVEAIQHQYGFQAFGVGVTFSIVFRAQHAWNRYWEAVTELHFMYSKWADAFSQFQAFVEVTKRAAETIDSGNMQKVSFLLDKQKRIQATFALLSAVAADRLSKGDTSLVGIGSGAMSRAELRVQRERRQQNSFELNLIEKNMFDRTSQRGYVILEVPSREQEELLRKAYDATTLVMYWILYELVDVMKAIDIPSPIQSRFYQELSNGMLGFNNCMKIADVPFPLPFAQLLGLLLMAFSCFIPLYVIVFTASPVVGPILCVLLFESLWCLSEVAKELENPFGDDPNDIPLSDFHLRFVDILEDLSQAGHDTMLQQLLMGRGDFYGYVQDDTNSSDTFDTVQRRVIVREAF